MVELENMQSQSIVEIYTLMIPFVLCSLVNFWSTFKKANKQKEKIAVGVLK